MHHHHGHHHGHHGHHGYGAPPPVYVATTPVYANPPPMYGAPPPMYGAPPVAYAVPPPPAGFIMPQYTPGMYTYNMPYHRHQPFVVPYGLPPHLVGKMMQASAVFRTFDRDCSGTLDKKEWKRAMKHMNYYIPKGYGKQLFYMVDRDRSGRISEREFCEWWLATH